MKCLVTLIVLILPSYLFGAPGDSSLYLISYTPGTNYDHNLGVYEQVGIGEHQTHLMGLYDANVLLMGGPLVDAPRAVVLVQVDSLERAMSIVNSDPAVINKIFEATVRQWELQMSSMRRFTRIVPKITDPDKPFRLERSDPGAPINIKE